MSVFFFFKICLFIAALGLCCCAWAFCGLGEQGLLSRGAQASLCTGSSCCGAQAVGLHASQQLQLMGSRALALQLSAAGLVAPRRVESSQTRDRTHIYPLHWQTDSLPVSYLTIPVTHSFFRLTSLEKYQRYFH